MTARTRPRTPVGELEWYCRRRATAGAFYVTCEDIAKDVALAPALIELVLAELADSSGDLTVERCGATGRLTWKIACR